MNPQVTNIFKIAIIGFDTILIIEAVESLINDLSLEPAPHANFFSPPSLEQPEPLPNLGDLSGPVRECLEWKVYPSGIRRCAKWTTDYKMCRLFSKPVCASKGACLGLKHRYAHPSVPEGTQNDYEAFYKLIEADDAITSHDPAKNFVEDSRYPAGVQDRDYSNPSGQDQAAVIFQSQTLDPDRVLVKSLTSSEGPSIVTEDNIVLSGNSRAMSIRLASLTHPEIYKKYKAALRERVNDFGFSVADVDRYEYPILVREVRIPDNEIFAFASFANKPVSRGLDTIGKSIELAKLVPDGFLERMEIGEGETLRSFLDTARGRDFLQIMLANTVRTERATIFNPDGSLTDTGKSIMEDALFAKIFTSRETLQALTPQVRRALEGALPELIRIRSGVQAGVIKHSWDLTRALDGAIRFAGKNLKGVSLSDWMRQMNFAGKDKLDFETLEGQAVNLLVQVGSKPRTLREKIRRFANLAEDEAAGSLFTMEPRDPAQTLKEIIASSKDDTDAALFGIPRD